MTMKTDNVKTATRTPMNRKQRRELKFAEHAILQKRTITEATIKKIAKQYDIDLTQDAGSPTAEAMIFGAIMNGSLAHLLTGVAMLRKDRETASQWTAKRAKASGRLGRAGIKTDDLAMGRIGERKNRLETLWISVIGEVWEAEAKDAAISALDRHDLAGNAIRAWKLGMNHELLDDVYGPAWRTTLNDAGIAI